ncbi:MAG: DNA translocase FtsK [Candidatus Peregrinibacteria bacterium]
MKPSLSEVERAASLRRILIRSRGPLERAVVDGLYDLEKSGAELDPAQHSRMAKAVGLMRDRERSASELVANVLVKVTRGINDAPRQRAAMVAELETLAELIAAVGRTRERVEAAVLDEGKATTDARVIYAHDPLYDRAVALVREHRQASISWLQRRLGDSGVGYNRAANLIERMEHGKVVGPSDGVRPRQILISPADPSVRDRATPVVPTARPTPPPTRRAETLRAPGGAPPPEPDALVTGDRATLTSPPADRHEPAALPKASGWKKALGGFAERVRGIHLPSLRRKQEEPEEEAWWEVPSTPQEEEPVENEDTRRAREVTDRARRGAAELAEHAAQQRDPTPPPQRLAVTPAPPITVEAQPTSYEVGESVTIVEEEGGRSYRGIVEQITGDHLLVCWQEEGESHRTMYSVYELDRFRFREAQEIIAQLKAIAPGSIITAKNGEKKLVVKIEGDELLVFKRTPDGEAKVEKYLKRELTSPQNVRWIESIAEPRYPIGQWFYIERNDGERHKAKVQEYNRNGEAQMIFQEEGRAGRRGDWGYKYYTIEELDYIQLIQAQSDYQKQDVGAREWNKVRREKEVMAVGDLHGEWAAFIGNLKTLKIIDEGGNWIAGPRKVVFHGDILADRGMDSFKILQAIAKLKKQARGANGELVVLAGNHEDFALSYLLGESFGENPAYMICFINGHQGAGLMEFKQFGSRDLQRKSADEFATWMELGAERPRILKKMRATPQGIMLLEQICDLRLAEMADDSLIVHTNPTPLMIEELLHHGVNGVNQKFQEGLRKALFDEGTPDAEFFRLRSVFLDTNNRTNFTNEVLARRLREELGVNQILYGHTDETGHGNPVDSKVGDKVGDVVLLVSVDRSAFKHGEDNGQRSVATIKKDGHILSGVHAQDLRAAA